MIFELFNFLKREGDFKFWKKVAILATIAGMANASLLSIVNTGAELVEDESENYRFFAMYITVFMIFFIAKKSALLKANAQMEVIIHNVRNRISNKLSLCELSTIESLDTASVFVRLTKDASVVANITLSITNATQSIIMMFFALIYVFYISPITFFIIIVTIICGILIYLSHSKNIREGLIKSYKIEDEFFHLINGILKGFKELKINSDKNRSFLKEKQIILDKLLILRKESGSRFVINMIFSEVFLYILLGSIIFIIPHFIPEKNSEVIKIVATTLFIIGPLTMTSALIPTISKASIAAKSLYDLELILDKNQKNLVQPIEKAEPIKSNFNTIELKKLEFHYLDKDKSELFAIGPIDLEIKKGELIFIIGGNGSGKSTFIKALIGLYFPHKGSISIDNELIGSYNYQTYRNLFSIILTDFYIFKKIYGLENIRYSKVNQLLVEMQIENKTKFVDNSYTNVNLSTGQRKRLALITSILEDKPIYVFDEWAADQDPEFRKYFYNEILKTLQASGKTVIAVTHDDAYFDMADRIFKMEYGKLNEYFRKS